MSLPPPSSSSPAARVGPSGYRRFWLTVTAWVGDHPGISLLGAALLAGAVVFYGIRLNGFAHMGESLSRWRMEVFGGTFRVERSIEVPDVILSFHDERYDRVDAATATAAFLGGTAFRKEIAVITSRPGARIRVVALDPRMGAEGHPRHADFTACAAALGFRPWEFAARSRHSVAVLLHLLEDFAPALEVRLQDTPLASVPPPFFAEGRSLQLYRSDNPRVRLDILVARPMDVNGSESFSRPGLIVRHRPDHPEVKRFAAAFEEAWSKAKPLDAPLQAELLKSLSSSQ